MVPLSAASGDSAPSGDKEQKGDKEKGDKVARDRSLQGQSSGEAIHHCHSH